MKLNSAYCHCIISNASNKTQKAKNIFLEKWTVVTQFIFKWRRTRTRLSTKTAKYFNCDARLDRKSIFNRVKENTMYIDIMNGTLDLLSLT